MGTNIIDSSFSIVEKISDLSNQLSKEVKEFSTEIITCQETVLNQIEIIQLIPDSQYAFIVNIKNEDSIENLGIEILRLSKKLLYSDLESFLLDIKEEDYISIIKDAKRYPGKLRNTYQYIDIQEGKDKVKMRLYLYVKYHKNKDMIQFELSKLRDYKTEIIHTLDIILSMVDSHDPETGEHLKRLSDISYFLATKLRETGEFDIIDNAFLENLKLTASIHDIGKMGVSDKILQKPGKLTSEEFEQMTFHTNKGADTIKKLQQSHGERDILEMAKNITLFHHEKWDGSGYPERLSGEEIPLEARIIAIVDVLDALKSIRPYKEVFSDEKTLGIIKESIGKHFDPVIANILLENWDEVLCIRKQNEDINKDINE